MTVRYRPHESVTTDGPWSQRLMRLVELKDWCPRWREDFAIEVNVLGQWTPAHVVLKAELIPSMA